MMFRHGIACLLIAWAASPPAAAETLGRAVDAGAAAQRSGARAQQRVEQLDDETRRLLEEWREVEREIADLERYREQLNTETAAQEEQLVQLDASMESAASLERSIVPLMLEMAATLKQFVGLDLPFLVEERSIRLARLDTALAQPDLDSGEKFRRLMEAWTIEAEYGRTLESWPGEIERPDGALQVNFLRVGRVSLLYQTLDGQQSGIWDRAAGAWKALPAGAGREIRKAIQVAREERAPGLLLLPVPAAEAAR